MDHLPWKYHLGAREAGVGLMEFHELPAAEQDEWIRFALHGPSKLRDSVNIAHIRSMIFDFLTGSKDIHGVDEEWLDGLLEHPDAALERRVEEARKKRRADSVAMTKALFEHENAARER